MGDSDDDGADYAENTNYIVDNENLLDSTSSSNRNRNRRDRGGGGGDEEEDEDEDGDIDAEDVPGTTFDFDNDIAVLKARWMLEKVEVKRISRHLM